LECLRKADSKSLDRANSLASNEGLLFSPLIDDFFVQESPSSQLHKGHFNQSVPFIHSVNLDEGTQIAASYANGKLTSDADFAAAIFSVYGKSMQPLVQDILRLYPNIPSLGQPNRPYYWGSSPNDTFYPPGKDGSINQYKRLSSFFHDAIIEAGRRQHLYAAVKVDLPVWSFRFAQPTPEHSPFAKFQSNASLGVQHASDIPFVFGHAPLAGNMSQQPEGLRTFITDDIIKKNTAAMTAYWIHFAARGDPNSLGYPHWPQYERVGGKELILQPEGIQIQDDTQHTEQTDFILSHSTDFGM
jgi:carboxylesterase type B